LAFVLCYRDESCRCLCAFSCAASLGLCAEGRRGNCPELKAAHPPFQLDSILKGLTFTRSHRKKAPSTRSVCVNVRLVSLVGCSENWKTFEGTTGSIAQATGLKGIHPLVLLADSSLQ
jgi:hypothetical protein